MAVNGVITHKLVIEAYREALAYSRRDIDRLCYSLGECLHDTYSFTQNFVGFHAYPPGGFKLNEWMAWGDWPAGMCSTWIQAWLSNAGTQDLFVEIHDKANPPKKLVYRVAFGTSFEDRLTDNVEKRLLSQSKRRRSGIWKAQDGLFDKRILRFPFR